MELKNKITKIKSSLDKINNRLEMTEQAVSEFENRSMKFMQFEQQMETSLEKQRTEPQLPMGQ